MSDSFDEFVQELQEQIYEDARESYGAPAFERWLNPATWEKSIIPMDTLA